jgi:Sulfatase
VLTLALTLLGWIRPLRLLEIRHMRALKHCPLLCSVAASALFFALSCTSAVSPEDSGSPSQKSQPNILVIMGDDIGWENLGSYHQGLMLDATPNLDKLAKQGLRFTDYYAEASCTAGRANFITGELPIRTGLTTVGQAGSPLGMPDQAPTIATALKADEEAATYFWRLGSL